MALRAGATELQGQVRSPNRVWERGVTSYRKLSKQWGQLLLENRRKTISDAGQVVILSCRYLSGR